MLDGLGCSQSADSPTDQESNRNYYLRRAREELAMAEACTCLDARDRHLHLAKLLLSVAGDHDATSSQRGADRTMAACLTPGFVILPGRESPSNPA